MFKKECSKLMANQTVFQIAIGFIFGTAFARMIGSLVNDVILPAICGFFNIPDISNWAITLREATDKAPEVILTYGPFFNSVIDFGVLIFI